MTHRVSCHVVPPKNGTQNPTSITSAQDIVHDVLTGRGDAGNLNDLLPNVVTNSNNPPPPTIPLKVLNTLDSILNTGKNLPNQAGGQEYENRNGKLPPIDEHGNPITYKKWDVDASKFQGNPRNAERLVTWQRWKCLVHER